MSILFDATRHVNSAPFAIGLGMACDPPAPPPWMTAVGEAMISLGYDSAAARAAAVAWLGTHGTLRGCPEVEPGDVPALVAVFARFSPETGPGGDVEANPADWPAWTDEWVWEPSESDRVWWAQQQDARERGHGFDRRAAESATLDGLERGLLIPADVAEGIMASSLVGHDA
jgi:hypothetical protein